VYNREEARRAYATFIRAGAAKELNLEDKVRERVKNQLSISTREFERMPPSHSAIAHELFRLHLSFQDPDCWLSAYEATYILSETASLPHFLSFAQAYVLFTRLRRFSPRN